MGEKYDAEEVKLEGGKITKEDELTSNFNAVFYPRDGMGSNTPFDPSDFPSLGGGAGGGMGAPGRPNYGKFGMARGGSQLGLGRDLGGKGEGGRYGGGQGQS